MKYRHLVLSLLCGLALACAVRAQENPYVVAGIPAPDHVWTGKEYLAVAQILEGGKVALPVLKDGFGADVFRRIVNPDNLAPIVDKTLPLADRLTNCGEMQVGFGTIMTIYARKVADDPTIHTELASLLAYALQSGDALLKVVNELPPIEMSDTEALQQRKQLNASLTQVFTGAEQCLGQEAFFSPADRSMLLTAMASTFGHFRLVLPEEYRVELKTTLTRHLEHYTGDDAANLKRMLAILPLPLEPIDPPDRPEPRESDDGGGEDNGGE